MKLFLNIFMVALTLNAFADTDDSTSNGKIVKLYVSSSLNPVFAEDWAGHAELNRLTRVNIVDNPVNELIENRIHDEGFASAFSDIKKVAKHAQTSIQAQGKTAEAVLNAMGGILPRIFDSPEMQFLQSMVRALEEARLGHGNYDFFVHLTRPHGQSDAMGLIIFHHKKVLLFPDSWSFNYVELPNNVDESPWKGF